MDGLNRYPLTALRALEATGRLRVTVGAVSQHIHKAEAQLGRSVFERTPRGLRATPVGMQLLASLTHGFQEIARAVAAAEARPSAVLTVSVAPVLAAKWLVPRLTRFYTAHPGCSCASTPQANWSISRSPTSTSAFASGPGLGLTYG